MKHFIIEFFKEPLLTIDYKRGEDTSLDVKSGSPAAILLAIIIGMAVWYLIGFLPK